MFNITRTWFACIWTVYPPPHPPPPLTQDGMLALYYSSYLAAWIKILQGGEWQCKSKVSCSRTEHHVSSKKSLSGVWHRNKRPKNLLYNSVFKSVNPLTPKSDYHLISHYNIAPESNMRVTRTKEMMITNQRSSWLLNKFSCQHP